MSVKRFAVILVVIFIGVYLFFNVLPVWIVRPAAVYHIYNPDDIDHYITVEMFDENNESVLFRNYTLSHEESVSLEREINWHLPFTSSFVSWNDETYRFNFTVDGNASKEYVRELSQYECISVWIYHYDEKKNEMIPIEIGIVCF
jgi:hypothetical protein